MNGYFTAKEVAAFLKLSLQTIRRYTMNKKIPFHKIDRAVRYKKSEIEDWVEKRQTEIEAAASENGQELLTVNDCEALND
ncbi:MAG: helix-turn-helix domain-containing protein [Treponema sp.]|nr:helix-turn-helix domain-containing protein [Treponema sp.]